MKNRRHIFFGIFGFYHFSAFLFTLYIDSQKQDFSFLSKMLNKIPLFKWGALLGLLLFVTDLVWWWVERRTMQKETEATRHENNTLKAKVYDLQEASKIKPITNPNT